MSLSVLRGGGAFFESPRWHDGAWWASDFYRHLVVRVTEDGAEEPVLEVPGQPSGLGWLPDGSLLVVSMLDRRIVRLSPGGEVHLHADLSELVRGVLNDMVVDELGRAYAGSFGYDPATEEQSPARLVLVQPDGGCSVQPFDLAVPNGAVITPAGTLIVGESMGSRYTEFDIDGDGSLRRRRLWAQVSPGPSEGFVARTADTFVPDGCTLDSDGNIWSADPVGRRCCLIAPGGEILETIAMNGPETAIACALGGRDGHTLLICAAPLSAHRDRAERGAVLMHTRVEAPAAINPGAQQRPDA